VLEKEITEGQSLKIWNDEELITIRGISEGTGEHSIKGEIIKRIFVDDPESPLLTAM
jgi:hypothetical protein